MKRLVVLLLFLFVRAAAAEDFLPKTLISLIANSAEADSKRIMVRGYLCRLGGKQSESFGLFIDRKDCDSQYYDKGIRAIVAKGSGRRIRNGFVFVFGKYTDTAKLVTTDNFLTGFIDVTKIEP
jgi:hypothetical protein